MASTIVCSTRVLRLVAGFDRFQRLMSPPPNFTLIEKSPINALRIGFLEAIVSDARFVHIVRNGVSVARSIEQMAAATRKLAFRPPLNNWWGVGGAKWTALTRDGMAASYYSDEVSQLTSDAQRGAYEWLLSTREVNAWRARLGKRLIELRLDDLISDPRTVIKSVIGGLGLSLASEGWLDEAAMKIHPGTNDYGTEMALPDQMLADSINSRKVTISRARRLRYRNRKCWVFRASDDPVRDPRHSSSVTRGATRPR